jgi:PhnB protein
MGSTTKLTPNVSLAFDGRCEAAFRLYEQCLNGTIAFMLTWGNSPVAAEAPPGWAAKIYHATLKVGETVIMGGDVPPARFTQPQGFSIVLQMDDPVAAGRVFEALSQHGTVETPLQETFWASRFAVLTDQFGIPWTINCERATESIS